MNVSKSLILVTELYNNTLNDFIQWFAIYINKPTNNQK